MGPVPPVVPADVLGLVLPNNGRHLTSSAPRNDAAALADDPKCPASGKGALWKENDNERL